MLIEIVFVRYRGLCDLLIYTIGFMHDDFFLFYMTVLVKWMVVTIDTKLVCLWNIQMFIFILSTNVSKYSNVGILYICIYFWSISNANTWNNSKFSQASIFLSSPSILLQESQTLPIFKELQYLQANQFFVECHHHQFYVAFSTLMWKKLKNAWKSVMVNHKRPFSKHCLSFYPGTLLSTF